MLRKKGHTHRRHLSGVWQLCRNLRHLKQIHGLMVVRGFVSDPSALRELIFCTAVSLPGAMPYAYKLFDRIPRPDLFLWNTIIRGAAHTPAPLDALSLYARMARSGIQPNELTFPFLLRACTKLESRSTGTQFHAKIVRLGLHSDAFTRNALINFHANCGDLAAASSLFDALARRDVVAWSALIAGYVRRGELGIARRLFEETPCKDLVAWNLMISAYAKHGEMERARELFDQVPERDVVSWNAMITGYVQRGSYEQAIDLYEEMCRTGERPDEVTMLCLLSACADSGKLDIGERMHQSLLMRMRSTMSNLSVAVGNALIDMYAKCGSIERAMEVFRGMRERDVSTWNSIIGGLAFHGLGRTSIALFREMQREEVKPDEITFIGVLSACSHGGMIKVGREFFSLMRSGYKIEPNVRHYGCMVDMLGRAGLLEEAFELVNEMKIEQNDILWRSLLGACLIHANVELGKRAKEELLKLTRDASGDYVLLSNVHALMGEWGGVEKVRKVMDDRGVMKETGSSVIEADDQEEELMHSCCLPLHRNWMV